MPSLHNRSGVYYATFSDSSRKPRQRRHSLKTRSRRTAERLLARLEEAHTLGTWDAWTQTPDAVLSAKRTEQPKRISEAVALYMAHAEATFTPATLKARRGVIRRFAQHVGAQAFLDRLTAAHVESFAVAGGVSAQTSNNRLTALKSFCRFCVEGGMLAESPAHKVRPLKTPPRLPRAVTDEEFEAVLKAIPEGRAWTRNVFRFAALTGLRASELARLRWSDVDGERRLLRIETQKNGKAQTQPIPRAALSVLDGVPKQGEYVFTSPHATNAERCPFGFTNLLDRAFRLGREKAGIQRQITPHGLRHRYCTKLAEAGASAFVIQAAARHANVQTSQRYVSIANETLKAELDAVFG